MAEQRSGPVVVFVGVLLLGAVAAVVLPKLFGVSASPEADLISQLKSSQADALEVPVAGSAVPLRSSRHEFQRITVSVAPDGRTATVVATLDFDGALGATKVSSLGAERIGFLNQE